jgi:hypothetical protein
VVGESEENPPTSICTAMAWGLALAVALLTAYPFAYSFWLDAELASYRYFSADAFYFLTIADRSVAADVFTFDGTYPTNGFHPIWGYFLHFAFSTFGLRGGDQLIFAGLSSLIGVAVGTGLFFRASLSVVGRPALLLLAIVPGALFFLAPSFDSQFPAQWVFINGMETAASILIFGITAWFLLIGPLARVSLGSGKLILLSALLTALTLSRLDDIFIFVPFLLWLASLGSSSNQRWKRLAIFCVVPTICIGAYLLYNLSYAGTLLPSSGAAKTQLGWALVRNGYATLTTLFPFIDLFGRGTGAWRHEAMRVFQMLAPVLVAGGWFVFHGRGLAKRALASWRGERVGADGADDVDVAGDADALDNHVLDGRTVVSLLAIYVCVKGAYNFSVVGLWHQGDWYYPLSIMIANLILARALAVVLDRAEPLWPSAIAGRRWLRSTAPLAAVVWVLLFANFYIEETQKDPEAIPAYSLWLERASVEATLNAQCGSCGVISYDDGMVAYALAGRPVMNGVGLALDRTAVEALDRGRLLDVAYERGYEVFATLSYKMPPEAYRNPLALGAYLKRHPHLYKENLDRWRFELMFIAEGSRVPFVHFEPISKRR